MVQKERAFLKELMWACLGNMPTDCYTKENGHSPAVSDTESPFDIKGN